MEEDWNILVSFFPENWKELAVQSNATKGLRKYKSAENLLRTLLIHLGCGYSLRETAVRANKSNLGDFSDVALLKRLRKSKEWFYRMCLSLFNEQGMIFSKDNFKIRLFDSSNVKEPGKTGSLWRIHYSIQLPSLSCDFFKVTQTEGKYTGDTFAQFPIKQGDYIIADRGYSTANGIYHIVSNNAYVIVRVNTKSLKLLNHQKKPFPLLRKVKAIKRTGAIKSWDVLIPVSDGSFLSGRLCAIRKTEEAIKIAHKKLKRDASKHGSSLQENTLEFAKYIIVFTNFPQNDFSAFDILEWYRIRWQIELVFKRFKSLAQLGHLPKHDAESSQAWLYGKLFVALLTEKLIEYASSVSPWGYLMEKSSTAEPLA